LKQSFERLDWGVREASFGSGPAQHEPVELPSKEPVGHKGGAQASPVEKKACQRRADKRVQGKRLFKGWCGQAAKLPTRPEDKGVAGLS
jgi:hypothetical protein